MAHITIMAPHRLLLLICAVAMLSGLTGCDYQPKGWIVFKIDDKREVNTAQLIPAPSAEVPKAGPAQDHRHQHVHDLGHRAHARAIHVHGSHGGRTITEHAGGRRDGQETLCDPSHKDLVREAGCRGTQRYRDPVCSGGGKPHVRWCCCSYRMMWLPNGRWSIPTVASRWNARRRGALPPRGDCSGGSPQSLPATGSRDQGGRRISGQFRSTDRRLRVGADRDRICDPLMARLSRDSSARCGTAPPGSGRPGGSRPPGSVPAPPDHA